jgi:3-oxoadipate enol-lactonase
VSDWIAFQIAGDRGPPLVFLHGLAGAAESWRPQLDHFAGRFRAIAWDMPGYGDSRPLARMTFESLAGALLRLLDRLSIGRAHLIGHSFGGMVAQEVAARHPERLRSLTLVATAAAFGRHGTAWQRAFVEQRLGPLDRGGSMAELAPELIPQLIGEAADPEGVAGAIESLSQVPEASYRAAISCLLSGERRAGLAEVPVPTLLVAGERDTAAPATLMARMRAKLPQARLVVLPGAGHLANLEQPEAFNRALEGFLASLGKGALR